MFTVCQVIVSLVDCFMLLMCAFSCLMSPSIVGSPGTIEVSYKQAEDYPVDLYYLLDLSSSMQDDLESLRKLGKELGEKMSNITKNFRLGFGSFVDKTVMPFISTVERKYVQ